MKTRAALAVLAAAGLANVANAQSITYTLSWIEVNANSSTPVAVSNGQIDPGEGARIRITANILPGIGATATYTPPPAPGTGTIDGLGSIFFDLIAGNANGGTWSNATRAAGFALGSAIGGTDPDGTLRAGQAGQFILPGSFANSNNPVNNIWQATWNPSSYASRTVTFQSAGAAAAGTNHSSILIQYGPDPQNDPQYVGAFVSAQFGGSGNIPVVPAPASLALLGLGGLVAARRRR